VLCLQEVLERSMISFHVRVYLLIYVKKLFSLSNTVKVTLWLKA